MKAMLFAAGLGTRLRPLTDHKPKALIEAAGKTLLEWNLLKLNKAGIHEVVVNIHHFPEQMRDCIHALEKNYGPIHISDESAGLLDTGGGLWNAAPFFAPHEPVVVHNVDILSNLDIGELVTHHRQSRALVTLAVKDRQTSRKLLFDDKNRLVGWKHLQTGDVRWSKAPVQVHQAFAYSGVHVVDSKLFQKWPKSGTFPLIPEYLKIAANHLVGGFVHEDVWLDVGKPGSPEKATEMLKNKEIQI